MNSGEIKQRDDKTSKATSPVNKTIYIKINKL